MAFRISNPVINDGSIDELIEVKASGELTVGCPCAIYGGVDGELVGIKCAVDANTIMDKIGVPVATIANGAVGMVKYRGRLKFASLASGGAKGKGVTAISIAGAVTAATDPSATNIDDGVIKGIAADTAGMIVKL